MDSTGAEAEGEGGPDGGVLGAAQGAPPPPVALRQELLAPPRGLLLWAGLPGTSTTVRPTLTASPQTCMPHASKTLLTRLLSRDLPFSHRSMPQDSVLCYCTAPLQCCIGSLRVHCMTVHPHLTRGAGCRWEQAVPKRVHQRDPPRVQPAGPAGV